MDISRPRGVPIISAQRCRPALARRARVIPATIHKLGPMDWGQHRTTERLDARHVQPLPRHQTAGNLPQGLWGRASRRGGQGGHEAVRPGRLYSQALTAAERPRLLRHGMHHRTRGVPRPHAATARRSSHRVVYSGDLRSCRMAHALPSPARPALAHWRVSRPWRRLIPSITCISRERCTGAGPSSSASSHCADSACARSSSTTPAQA